MSGDDEIRRKHANDLRSIVEENRDVSGTSDDDSDSKGEHKPRPGESPHAFEVRRSREIALEHEKHRGDH